MTKFKTAVEPNQGTKSEYRIKSEYMYGRFSGFVSIDDTEIHSRMNKVERTCKISIELARASQKNTSQLCVHFRKFSPRSLLFTEALFQCNH